MEKRKLTSYEVSTGDDVKKHKITKNSNNNNNQKKIPLKQALHDPQYTPQLIEKIALSGLYFFFIEKDYPGFTEALDSCVEKKKSREDLMNKRSATLHSILQQRVTHVQKIMKANEIKEPIDVSKSNTIINKPDLWKIVVVYQQDYEWLIGIQNFKQVEKFRKFIELMREQPLVFRKKKFYLYPIIKPPTSPNYIDLELIDYGK